MSRNSCDCPTPRPTLRSALRPVRGEALRVALTALMTLIGVALSLAGVMAWPAYCAALILGGAPAAWRSLVELRRGEIDVDLLMVVAAIGAASIGAWFEGALLLTLFSLGGLLEEISLARTESAVASLMALRPDVVHLVTADGPMDTEPDQVAPGAVIRVLPGERVALDGQVQGTSARLDQAALTGESALRTVRAGDEVPAGAIVADAPLDLRVLRGEAESTLARMIGLVAAARETTTRTGALIDRWLGRYVIAVLAVTAVAYVVLRLAGSGDAFLQAMTLLVVASPCALVIGLPATVLSGLAAAARAGVLVKGATPLLALGDARVVMLDKTGTITTGQPRLAGVQAQGLNADEVLALAAACEEIGGHPLARAICDACPGTPPPASGHLLLAGEGVEASVAGHGRVAVLSPAGAIARGIDPAQLTELDEASGACVLRDGALIGTLVFEDPLRSDAAESIRSLTDLGLQVEVLSGDRPHLAESVGSAVGAQRSRGNMTPAGKLEAIAAERRGVIMVGDGINDAPALAAADVGVAMGGRGVDQALEAGDVVLMADRLDRLAFAVDISRRTRRLLVANMALGVGMIALLVVATLLGDLPLPLGVLGHEGSTVLVTLNGLRLLAVRPAGVRSRRGGCPGATDQDGVRMCGRLAEA